MSDPLLWTALGNLQTTLQSIAVTGGYNFTVKATSVVLDPPAAILSTPPTEVPFICIGTRIDPLHRELNAIGRTGLIDEWRVNLEIVLDATSSTEGSKLYACLKFEQDLERAIKAATTWWPIGGGVQYVTVQQGTRWLGVKGNPRCFIEQPLDLRFHRVYGVA